MLNEKPVLLAIKKIRGNCKEINTWKQNIYVMKRKLTTTAFRSSGFRAACSLLGRRLVGMAKKKKPASPRQASLRQAFLKV